MTARPDAAELRAELMRRGAPFDVATSIASTLAAKSPIMRLATVLPVLAVLPTSAGLSPAEVADDAARMLRTHGYLPEPSACRWCGAELHARSHVAVLIDGIACARCALSRGVS